MNSDDFGRKKAQDRKTLSILLSLHQKLSQKRIICCLYPLSYFTIFKRSQLFMVAIDRIEQQGEQLYGLFFKKDCLFSYCGSISWTAIDSEE
jgi:hypothetical protein